MIGINEADIIIKNIKHENSMYQKISKRILPSF